MTSHGTVTVRFNGHTATVGFDIHAQTPVDQTKDLIRSAAVQCVADFFEAGDSGEPESERGVAAYSFMSPNPTLAKIASEIRARGGADALGSRDFREITEMVRADKNGQGG